MWNGIAKWMGVNGDRDLDFVLPNCMNFDRCSTMFTAHDLFEDSINYPCINDYDGDGVEDSAEYWIDAAVDLIGCQAPTTLSPTTELLPTITPTWSPTPSGAIYEAEEGLYDPSSKFGSSPKMASWAMGTLTWVAKILMWSFKKVKELEGLVHWLSDMLRHLVIKKVRFPLMVYWWVLLSFQKLAPVGNIYA